MIKSSKKLIFIFSFLLTINFYTPVFASYFQSEHGFSGAQVTSLFAVSSLSVFLFEIPTGLMSDRLGEKKSLIVGSVLTVISTTLFVFGNMPLLYIGELIYGLGSTFFSGPFESLVFKYCRCPDNNLDYDKLLSKLYSLQWLALCFSFIGCSLFTNYGNLKVPFVATLAANILLCIITIFLPSINKEKEQKINTLSIMKGYITEIGTNRQLRTVSLLSVFFSVILVSGYQILQTYLMESSMPKSQNGLLYFVAAVFASCGSFFYDKLQKITKSQKMLLLAFLLLISVCCFALANVTSVVWIFILVSSYRLVWGVASPMFASMVNKSIEKDDYRNTAFSMNSLASSLSSSVLLFSFVQMDLSVKCNYISLGVLSVALFIMCVCSKSVKLSVN